MKIILDFVKNNKTFMFLSTGVIVAMFNIIISYTGLVKDVAHTEIQLKEAKAQITSQITGVETQINELTSDVRGLEAQIAVVDNKLLAVESQLTGLNGRIDDLIKTLFLNNNNAKQNVSQI